MHTNQAHGRLLISGTLLTLLIFLADLYLALDIAIPAFYVVGLVLIAALRNIEFILFASFLCSIFTFIPVISTDTQIPPFVWENRCIALTLIWLTFLGALFYLKQAHWFDSFSRQDLLIQQQNYMAVSLKEVPDRSERPHPQLRKIMRLLDEIEQLHQIDRKPSDTKTAWPDSECQLKWSLTPSAAERACPHTSLKTKSTMIDQDLMDPLLQRKVDPSFQDDLAHLSRLAMMGELAAGLSHELNQPLTAITNYSSSVKQLLPRESEVYALVAKIESQSLRCGELVRRIKNLVNKRKQERQEFALLDVLQDSLELLDYEIRMTQIQVEISSDHQSARVFADPVQVEQVLLNLLKNAVEAMLETPFPRTLRISISLVDEWTSQISIADTGAGLSAAVKHQLFKPFMTTKQGGLGIGLSLSHSLITASDGQIWYEPNENGGATFSISLPAKATAQKAA